MTDKDISRKSAKKGLVTSEDVKKAFEYSDDFQYVGDRIRYVREFTGETRDHMATVLNISVPHYGMLERQSSASIKTLSNLLNYFATHYNINASWILIRDNGSIPMEVNKRKDVKTMIEELNSHIKDQGLMVNLVSK